MKDLLNRPVRLVARGGHLRRPLRISSLFSGTGMAECCEMALGDALGQQFARPVLWIEHCNAAATIVKRLMSDAVGVRDIYDLLPITLRTWCTSIPRSFQELRQDVVFDALAHYVAL